MAEVSVEELLKRVEGLEHIIHRSGLDKAGFLGGALKVIRADKDRDGDFDPYISTSWDGASFSTSTGTIDWNADFGVPPGAKMVFLQVVLRDSSATPAAGKIFLQAKSTTTTEAFYPRSFGSDVVSGHQGWVAVAPNGTSYYSIIASGTNTCDIWIRMPLYAR